MRATEFITEYRDRLLQYVKSLLPTWPEYVLKDWLVPNKGDFSNLPDTELKNGIMEKLQGAGLTPDTKWQLVPDMKFTMDMFDPMTKQRLIGRAGGKSDLGMQIPRDAERHATQAALAQQQGGVRKEPVLLIKMPNGYELLEGWHRTIQHFAQYPQGYTGPAYVAVAQGPQGVAEGKLIESAVFLNPNTVVVGQEHGQPLELSPDTLKKVQAIAAKHGAYYEGNGTDRSYTKGQIDRYTGSWDDEVAKTASSNDPKWLYVLFANVDENNRVKRVGVDPKDTIFNRLMDSAQDNSFQGIGYTAQALQKFLQMASEGKYDFVKMSQQPATQENLTRFLKAGEALMWPSNWEQYPNRAGKIAKAATVDVRDRYLATRKAGVYVTGSGHLKAVQNITGKQGVAENFADQAAVSALQKKHGWSTGRTSNGDLYFTWQGRTYVFYGERMRITLSNDYDNSVSVVWGMKPNWQGRGNNELSFAQAVERKLLKFDLSIWQQLDRRQITDSQAIQKFKVENERQAREAIAQGLTEAFDQPYELLRWEKGDFGDVDAIARLDDGTFLSIMFNKGFSKDSKEEAWSVEFYRNNSQEVTGEGDQQRVFATVLSAIQTFIKKYTPNRITFSASKEVEQGQNAQSRARLYDSLVQRYARAWGFRAFRADTGNKVIYELSRIKQPVAEGLEHYNGIEISMEKEDDEIMVKAMMSGGRELGHVLFVIDGEYLAPQDLEVDERYQGQGIAATMYDYVKSKGYKIRRSGQQTDAGAGFWDKHKPGKNVWEQSVAENFADGKNPGRKGLSRRVGIPKKATLGQLEKIAQSSTGERRRMAQWQLNMRRGKKK